MAIITKLNSYKLSFFFLSNLERFIYKIVKPVLLFTALLVLLSVGLNAQNESSKWYFGDYAGLDFMTNPPTILNNSAMFALEGTTSISDASGNLLFYTEGTIIYNQLHQPMANGTGLDGNGSTTQSSIIIQKPGSQTIYYVFTLDAQGWANGLRYSTVDMTLAAGMGSVTSKNVPLYTPSTEKLTATKHCNGTDIWIMTHDFNSNGFRAFLVTSAGVNTTPVLSAVGTFHGGSELNAQGGAKFSTNGKKLALASRVCTEVFDFDNATGIVSNPIFLTNVNTAWGVEFSPDGTKLYSTAFGYPVLYQWDLCAGSSTAVAASQYTLWGNGLNTIQLATNGKIYCSSYGLTYLSVVNDPNLLGASCNFVVVGQSIAPGKCYYGLPNFTSSFFKPAPLPFTFSINCMTVNFTPSLPNTCSAAGNSVIGQQWNFDDPLSGSSNSSNQPTPSHVFTSSGTYSVQLIRHYQCNSDTVILPVTITTNTALNVLGNFNICKGEAVTYTATGADSYTWSSASASTPTIILSPSVMTVYTVSGSKENCDVQKSFTVTVSNCTGINSQTNNNSIVSYPNPFSDFLSIDLNLPSRVELTNVKGECVLSKSFEAGEHRINTLSFHSGVYILKTINSSGTNIIRLLKID